jgi:hypothetical protein
LKELIFHIGTPKTGTSALQVFLAKNREDLLNKNVDYLPIGEIALGTAGKISSGNGAFVSRSLLPAGAPARIADGSSFFQECYDVIRASPAEVGVISSELFTYADTDSFKLLLADLRTMGILPRCVYFVRSQPQCLASIYMQEVKRHGCTRPPAEYIRNAYPQIGFLKHYSFYLQQCDLFARSNVFCRVYEAAIGAKHGLFRSFLQALPADTSGLAFDNTSLSPRDLCIMLMLNRYRPRMKFSDSVVENAVQFGATSSGAVHSFLARDLIEELREYFAKENDALAGEYFHRSNLFASISRPDVDEDITVDSLSPGDLLAFCGGLLVRYDERLAALEAKLAKESSGSFGSKN